MFRGHGTNSEIDGGCLQGIVCPKCGHNEVFRIYASSWFRVDDDGAEDHADVEWDDDSQIHCFECGHNGAIREFRVEHQASV